MMKTKVMLVTWFETPKKGHTRAFELTPERGVFRETVVRELPQFNRDNSRPYATASAAIRKSDTAQEVVAYWGKDWLPEV